MSDLEPTLLKLEPNEEFGAWVLRVREARAWTREHLAELAEVLPAQVERVESGSPLRQHSSRVRLRTVLESGEAYRPIEAAVEEPPPVDPPKVAKTYGPPTPLERLATHAQLLGAPREGGTVAAQASAFARWVAKQPQLWEIRLSSLLPGVSGLTDRPSQASRTLRTHEVLRQNTADAWSELGEMTLEDITALPRGDRRMATELVETAATGWARIAG